MENPYLEWLDENGQAQRLEIVYRIFIGRICQGVEAQQLPGVEELSVGMISPTVQAGRLVAWWDAVVRDKLLG